MNEKNDSSIGNVTTIENEVELLCKIRTKFDSMPKSHKKIADYVLNNPENITNVTITQLAKKIGTDAPTITRFCQSLNFSGFPEFKFCVEKGTLNSIIKDENINQNDSVLTIKKKLRIKYLQAIDETIMLLNEQKLEHAANVIINANKIYFFSHGGSGVAAQFGQVLFMQIGIPCFSFNDTVLASMAATQLKRGDVAIGISYSGTATTTVDALKTAKSNGITTIGITGFANSLITRYSDIELCYNARIDDDIRYLHMARMCETTIIGILQLCILNKNYEKLSTGIQSAKDAFIKGRYTC